MINLGTDDLLDDKRNEDTFDLREEAQRYLVNWKWFLLSLAISLIGAFAFLKIANPLYLIQADILIKDEKTGLGQEDVLQQLNMFSSSKVVDNEIKVLKSFTLMEKVVKDLNLQVSYFSDDSWKQTELYGDSLPVELEIISLNEIVYSTPISLNLGLSSDKIEFNNRVVPYNKVFKNELGSFILKRKASRKVVREMTIEIRELNAVLDDLVENLSVEASSKMSSVLTLQIESSVPQKGKDILNKLIESYNLAGLADKNQVALNTLRFIEERLKFLSQDLSTVEKSVENFKAKEGITDIGAESQLFLEAVKENDAKLNQVKIQQSVLNTIRTYVNSQSENLGLVPATLGIGDATLLAIISELSRLQNERRAKVQVVKQDNPIVKALDEQISSLKSNLVENVESLDRTLKATRIQLEAENSKMESMIQTVPRKERELLDVSRQQGIKNNLYVFLLQKREETELAYASAASDVRNIDAPRSTSDPVRPRPKIVYLSFFALGLIIPFVIVYLSVFFDDKIHNRKDIEKETNVPIIGELGHNQDGHNLIVHQNSRSALSEQFRALRTNISFYLDGKKEKIALLTSSMSGEGKSFTALNLGNILALQGKRVLMMELDLRKPGLSPKLAIENRLGFTNYVIDENIQIDDIINNTNVHENLYIISSGPVPPNPAEMLLSDRTVELLRVLRSRFDYIIIDAPPIGIVTDAQLLAPYVDMCMYLVRQNYTSRKQISIVRDLYIQKKVNKIGIIVNDIDTAAGYGYGYGYGYGSYGLEDQNVKKGKSWNFFK